ncbi:MAG: GAF domain-containing protein [Acidobacteria bacterium]|nr:GAF domain-containing protein [Acidobacteriota bacterium]
MATDQDRQQAVDALLGRLREETETAVRGFVNDVVARADADRQQALDAARQGADAAVQAAVDAARKDVRAELDGLLTARLQEAEAAHGTRVAALEAKLAETREQAETDRTAALTQAESDRAAALTEARKRADAERAAAVAEARASASTEGAKALAEAREAAAAEQSAALAEARELADAEQAKALAEARARADAERAEAVTAVRQETAAEQVAALSRARKEAAAEQAEALSRVRREAAAAQAEAVARAQDAAAQAAANAGTPSGGAATSEGEVRLALDSGHSGVGSGPAGGDPEDGARVSEILDAVRHLDEQTTLTSLLEALTERAAAYASRAALFIRIGGQMQGWRFAGFDSAMENGAPSLNGTGSGFLGRAIDEGRALVLTPPPGEDELDWPPAFASLPPDRSAIAVPVSVGGQPMVALYADDAAREGPSTPSAWSDAIELLARHAGCCIEALTANHAAGLTPAARRTGSEAAAAGEPAP